MINRTALRVVLADKNISAAKTIAVYLGLCCFVLFYETSEYDLAKKSRKFTTRMNVPMNSANASLNHSGVRKFNFWRNVGKSL